MTIDSLAVKPIVEADLEKPEAVLSATEKGWLQPISQGQKILHLLNRAAFGPRPGDFERVRQMGPEAYLEEQLHPEKIDDSSVEAKMAALPTLSMRPVELLENFPPPRLARRQGRGSFQTPEPQQRFRDTKQPEEKEGMRPETMAMEGPRRVLMELAREELWRAVYSNRQLQEVMVQFWMNHFNIFAPKGADKWLMTSFEKDTVRPRALGKFEDLLVATAKSPAMLFYLDNWMSVAPNASLDERSRARWGKPATRWRQDWRGLRGPFAPPQWGRPFDVGRGALRRQREPRAGRPLPGQRRQNRRGLNENYARELMELHAMGVDGGYTQRDVIEVARCLTGWTIDRPQQGGSFVFDSRLHDSRAKVVLGHKIRAGRGMEDGLEVLHLLAHHPSTARFMALKLCRRFIADDPPDAAVDRARKAFIASEGDIRGVLRTILTSPEFYSQTAFRAKVKSPIELVASSLRAFGGETDADVPLLQLIARMGQPMFQYQAPTGFPDRASTWISSSMFLARLNFALLFASNRIQGTQVNFTPLVSGGDVRSSEEMLERFAQDRVGGTLSPQTRQAILKYLVSQKKADLAGESSRTELSTIASLLIASPEFQRR